MAVYNLIRPTIFICKYTYKIKELFQMKELGHFTEKVFFYQIFG